MRNLKENKNGITLVSLVITIIVLLILASIATYSGINVIRSSKMTAFTTELKIMQTQVNELYQKDKNGEKVQIGSEQKEISDLGEDLSQVQSQANIVFQKGASGIENSDGYRYWSNDLIKKLGIEGVEQAFFINLEKRSVVSYEGYTYEGVTYYTLDQVPQGLYNVDYDPNQSNPPTFDVDVEKISEDKWRITISNIQYEGYIDKWKVQYKLDGQDYWNTSEDLSFVVNEKGIYNIYIENGDVKSDEIKKALDTPESTPEIAEGLAELEQMLYGVIEVEFLDGTSYNITEIANEPVLSDDMRAVYWGNVNGEIEETAANNTTEIDSISTVYKEQNWYNYESQETDTTNGGTSRWANAIVTVEDVDSYFVWIPRYAYRIVYFKDEDSENKYRAGTLTEEEALKNNLIVGYSDARGIVNAQGLRPSDVNSQTAISVNDKYFKTHPAFEENIDYGGWSSKLEGIWVAKYEASRAMSDKPKSEPGVSGWRNITVGSMFTNAQNYNTTLNSHLIKNSEWGAVAYLTESKYGRNGTEVSMNLSDSCYTGGDIDTAYVNNTNQSSTGNVYGIYDLSGGAYEYVAGYCREGNSLTSGSSFTDGTSDEYATAYDSGELSEAYKYGDATYETSGWNDDYHKVLSVYYPFLNRGGAYKDSSSAGVFYYSAGNGGMWTLSGFRICLAVQ